MTDFEQKFGVTGYLQEAQAALLSANKTLEQSAAWRAFAKQSLNEYQSGTLKFEQALKKAQQIAQDSAVNEKTALLLFHLLLAPTLREKYQAKNIPLAIFEDSVRDLLYKAKECHTVYGVWGSFVAPWFEDFFHLKRFALGRLQFERAHVPKDCIVQGKQLFKGTPALNLHIPSSGPLTKELCEDSFQRAKSFFGEEGKETVFLCDSWLLFPRHREILSPESGICRFMDLFTLIECREQPEFFDAWRVFGKEVHPPYEDLRQDTALQRGYARWLKAGEATATGVGIAIR